VQESRRSPWGQLLYDCDVYDHALEKELALHAAGVSPCLSTNVTRPVTR
jgi:hypothetical protein